MAGRKVKKGTKGAVTNYISRAQAVRKLQVSLAGFRRLCILKGVYPREPRNRKKVGRGSTAPKTYYFKKDIQFLLHEPILNTLREQKIHAKKVSRAIAKHEWDLARSIAENKPALALTHIVKERYPTFVDALRDLDDCLSMVFLFATMPSTNTIHTQAIEQCQRLSAEFQHYVMWTGALRKVFLSIKGIYYQAEIKGQTITWIVPYQFSQHVPTDVDFKVMGTFLELYRVVLTFVNFKLYRESGLIYPPKIDEVRNNEAGGLAAYSLEQASSTIAADVNSNVTAAAVAVAGVVTGKSKAERAKFRKTEKRIESLQQKLSDIARHDANEEEERFIVANSNDNNMDSKNKSSNAEDGDVPTPSEEPRTLDETVANVMDIETQPTEEDRSRLFTNCVFFLSREVPRYALEFVIRAMGGTVGWDATLGAGSPLMEDDASITHHIVDRDALPASVARFPRREFVQPQFVFDCINARHVLNAQRYSVGKSLPPHLSPFVEAGPHDYVPEAASELLFAESARTVAERDGMLVGKITSTTEDDVPQGEILAADDDDSTMVDSDEEIDDDEGDEDGEEVVLSDSDDGSELEVFDEAVDDDAADAALEAEDVAETANEELLRGTTTRKTTKKMTKAERQAAAAAEEKELAKAMMSKRDRRLYDQIQHGIARKEAARDVLERKRRALQR